ncbi:hypothetical protein [Robertkochia aurantiaca]|uniref:hypothetical protein n=1 Tax=Robertkochia aurantiaca TaxID=2873700 RepID=UPI001CCEE856|nr:hypothetical protein [Robertkochia sp. 3YJGBD-33]
MKIKTKFYLASPLVATVGYILLIYVPYLYKPNFFPFLKVFDIYWHTLICLFITILIIIARIFVHYPKLLKLDPTYIIVPSIPKKWYQVSFCFVLMSLIMNAFIVFKGLNAYTGNVNISKATIKEFGGINIISQLCLFFIVPFIIYSFQKKLKSSVVVVGLLILLVTLRSYFMAERLALIELVLPLFLVYLIIQQKRIQIGKLFKYIATFVIFFMIFELSRQFKNQYGNEELDLGYKISWTLERLFAYYGDTQNKFYYGLENELAYTTNHYSDWIANVLENLGINLSSKNRIDYGEFRWRDFTNHGGLNMIYTDFGILGLIIGLVTIFWSFFLLWFRLINGNLFAWSVYPFFFIWILELARYNPFYLTRFLVPLFVFMTVYPIVKYVRFK